MEERGQLKSGAEEAASMAPAENPIDQSEAANGNNSSDKFREEGELSSGDEEECPNGSASQLTATTASQVEPVQVASVDKNMQEVKTGQNAPTSNPDSFAGVHSRSSLQPNQHKNFEKNRGPFVPFVISFSDDDSGSDAEDNRKDEALEISGNSMGVDGSRRAPVSSLVKSQTLQRATRKQSKVVPPKASLSRAFVSSISNINRATSRNSVPLSAAQKSHVRNPNLNKRLTVPEHLHKHNVHVNTSKLQDLRQQIIIRENELKLKAAQQSKEMVASTCKNRHNINLGNDTARASRATSTDNSLCESEEPNKKRLKLSEVRSSKQISDGQQIVPPVRKTSTSEKSMFENCGINIDDGRYDHKENDLGVGCKKQDEARGQVASENLPTGAKEGTEVVVDGSQCRLNTRLVNPSSSSGRTPREDNWIEKVPPTQSAYHDNTSPCNCLGKVNISGNMDLDMQSILDIEEKQDKELEEAQEHRRQCEIEERDALRVYRKAQRALIEANARCSYLYRRRELYSAHFRSLMMEGSSFLWSSIPQSHGKAGLAPLSNMPEVNAHMEPTSNIQMLAELDVCNQRGEDLNVQSASGGVLQNLSDKHVDEQFTTPGSCDDTDATSEHLKDNGMANVVCSPSDDLNILSYDNEESFPIDHRSGQSNQGIQREAENDVESLKDNDGSRREFSSDGCLDTLLLEASLRSQLFARLGNKTLSKKGGQNQNTAHPVESGVGNNDDREITEKNVSSVPFSAADEDLCSDITGVCFSSKRAQSSRHVGLSYPVLRSAFDHMKVTHLIDFGSDSRSWEAQAPSIYYQKGNGAGCDGFEPSSLNPKSFEVNLVELDVQKMGSYNYNLAIDPLWPLCMYELRGKCNNDECSLQHARDYCGKRNSDNFEERDFQVDTTPTNLSKCVDSQSLAPPTYTVCLDSLKADLCSYKSVLVQGVSQCWHKCFSSYLVLSSSVATDLPSDEPFLHATVARNEVQGSSNKRLLYLHSKNSNVSRLNSNVDDDEHSLEMALLSINQKVKKQKSQMEAINVLVQALEACPTSVVLWIVYLHIYYSKQKSVGKDDLFQSAVEQNEGSYELWLLYINSRMQFDDRLAAYESALSSLCYSSSASDRDRAHDSECILDLFLEMMNFLCISGNYGKAIEKIHALFPSSKKSDNPSHRFLPDILTSLSVSHKSILWICCVYLVVYRKLPDSIVQQFECQKELPYLVWSSSYSLTDDEKLKAVSLMEMAVDSLGWFINSELNQSEDALKAIRVFAINHIGFISVIEGFECGRNLLEKYKKMHPFCVELVLMFARMQEQDSIDSCFAVFEEAISNWFQEAATGVDCIWNQYAEVALKNGKFDLAKELIGRWYDSRNGDSVSSEIDGVFGLINLSLHKLLLQNDRLKGRLALDRALVKAADVEDYYKHCLREHAMFLVTDGLQFTKDAPMSAIMDVLKFYLVDSRASEPLSRKFMQSIKSPRIRQQVSNLFALVSLDFSRVNLVLESWFGSSLLPKKPSKLSELVDFVEAVMEVVPSNYQLAISTCKLVSKNPSSTPSRNSISFWASSVLVNSLFQAVPIAPEYVWVEAATVLHELTDIQSISKSFYRRALSVYPFSIKLWESYINFSRVSGCENSVIEAAKERGIVLG